MRMAAELDWQISCRDEPGIEPKCTHPRLMFPGAGAVRRRVRLSLEKNGDFGLYGGVAGRCGKCRMSLVADLWLNSLLEARTNEMIGAASYPSETNERSAGLPCKKSPCSNKCDG